MRVISVPVSRLARASELDGDTWLLLAEGVALALPRAGRDGVAHIFAVGGCTVTAAAMQDPEDPAETVESIAMEAGDSLLLVSDNGAPWRVSPARASTELLAARVAALESGNFAADLLPSVDDTYDVGSTSLRWAHVYGHEVHTGDLLMERQLPSGETVRWRLVEYPDRIEARNEISGSFHDFLLIAHQDSGPWWKRLLRRALLHILRGSP